MNGEDYYLMFVRKVKKLKKQEIKKVEKRKALLLKK